MRVCSIQDEGQEETKETQAQKDARLIKLVGKYTILLQGIGGQRFMEEGVIEGSLGTEHGTGWLHATSLLQERNGTSPK